MRLEEFNYFLPPERIAKHPARPRDAGRLLVVGDSLGDGTLLDLPKYLKAGDLLVVNNVRVLAGRLTGRLDTQAVEITLLEQDKDPAVWAALAKPRKIFTPGAEISFAGGMMARVVRQTKSPSHKRQKGQANCSWRLRGRKGGLYLLLPSPLGWKATAICPCLPI